MQIPYAVTDHTRSLLHYHFTCVGSRADRASIHNESYDFRKGEFIEDVQLHHIRFDPAARRNAIFGTLRHFVLRVSPRLLARNYG